MVIRVYFFYLVLNFISNMIQEVIVSIGESIFDKIHIYFKYRLQLIVKDTKFEEIHVEKICLMLLEYLHALIPGDDLNTPSDKILLFV